MAVLYITEYVGYGRGHNSPDANIHPLATPVVIQQLTISSSSVASTAFNSATSVIRLHADAICAVTIATSPTASAATSARMSANQTEYFTVPFSSALKVAVITTT